MSIMQTVGLHNIAKVDIVPSRSETCLGRHEYDADREDDAECDEITVWTTRKGEDKGKLDVLLEGERVGLISPTPFDYSGDK